MRRNLHGPVVWFVCAFVGYCLVLLPFTSYLQSRPVEEKLGYIPSISVLKALSFDHREFAGASLIMKTVMYFGGLSGEVLPDGVSRPPDFKGMSRILHAAVRLDPYNLDAYYFAQAFLTWDVKQYKIANDLLDYGMKYRTWDWMLPFFAGFNSAYFLKDYERAGQYYRRAGELSGSELHLSLAGRYMQEAGQTELAIAYLTAMVQNERNQAIKVRYQIRLEAFREVRKIELARDRFRAERGEPDSVEQLMSSGYLAPAPVDPYGGKFILEPGGRVSTTSNFIFGGKR